MIPDATAVAATGDEWARAPGVHEVPQAQPRGAAWALGACRKEVWEDRPAARWQPFGGGNGQITQ